MEEETQELKIEKEFAFPQHTRQNDILLSLSAGFGAGVVAAIGAIKLLSAIFGGSK